MASEHFDAVVVGSGFGGSVAAYRLAEAGKRVLVLERGKAYPPGSFPRRPHELQRAFWDPSEGHHGQFDVWDFEGIGAVVGSGLGGGSLIYANVLLRKPEGWFSDLDPATGRDTPWPVTRAMLEPHYDRVEKVLKPALLPIETPGYALRKTTAFRDAAQAAGFEWGRAPLAVTFANPHHLPTRGQRIVEQQPNLHGVERRTCTLCGECDLGCNEGSKNTLDLNYLSMAKRLGADLRTRREVRTMARHGSGYRVSYVDHSQAVEGKKRTQDAPSSEVTCDTLVLGAGTLGSTYLLLKNRQALGIDSPALGKRFSGNGDLLSFAVNAKDSSREAIALDSSLGPVITSFARLKNEGRERGFYVEDAGYPIFGDWLVQVSRIGHQFGDAIAFLKRVFERSVGNAVNSSISDLLSDLLDDPKSKSTLPLLGMGRDTPDGTLRLDGRGLLETDWAPKGSNDYFARLRQAMEDIAGKLGADWVETPLARFQRFLTVHPLGGCPMGVSPGNGVVDSDGRAYGHSALYVVDGAVMPGPVGPNPSLTIAALADRFSDAMLQQPHPAQVQVPASAPVAAAAAVAAPAAGKPIPLTVQEWMKGYLGLGAKDHPSGFQQGVAQGTPFEHDVVIEIDDIDRFVHEPDHAAKMTGHVDSATYGRCALEDGVFNMFVDASNPRIKNMFYRMWFTSAAKGKRTLFGFKTVHDDKSLDLWSDTTTLYVRVYEGHLAVEPEDRRAEATGIIHIQLFDLMRQIVSFSSPGSSPGDAKYAMGAFLKFFMGALFEIYGPVAKVGT